ncbi:hypothetical protein CRE_22835 [Caenorhabditis remanei]|uniref:Uncharacterized protein n=1 Tax=Caenorhabditis remanei TaxID=31234 RepID=E3MHH0_CAERE|nr:hypothetical protein CRE_22835 [Caenorhabditis remanei]
MEFVLLTRILMESNPLDEIKAAIAKYPVDHVFRKKCEMAVAVREERPFDAIRIAVELNGGNAVAGFIADQIERAFQSRNSLQDSDRAYFLQKFRRQAEGRSRNLKDSDHAYIREEYNRNNRKLTINQKREIAEHLGVHESMVHKYVNNLRDISRKLQRKREQAEKEKRKKGNGSRDPVKVCPQ